MLRKLLHAFLIDLNPSLASQHAIDRILKVIGRDKNLKTSRRRVLTADVAFDAEIGVDALPGTATISIAEGRLATVLLTGLNDELGCRDVLAWMQAELRGLEEGAACRDSSCKRRVFGPRKLLFTY
jgi:hypothetical protein